MNSYYFTHDYNAANDVKILFLRQKLGMEGYGIYWYLIENLANAGGYLPLNIIPILAMQIQDNDGKVEDVIYNFELFVIDDNKFSSARLLRHIEARKVLSEKGKEGALKRWQNSPPNSPPIAPPNAIKERKEKKEIKRENDLVFNKSKNQL